MQGHFGHLHFKTFAMTPRTPQCEVFWPLLSNSKHSGVPEDSKSPTLGVGVSSSHFTQSGVATRVTLITWYTHVKVVLFSKTFVDQIPCLKVVSVGCGIPWDTCYDDFSAIPIGGVVGHPKGLEAFPCLAF